MKNVKLVSIVSTVVLVLFIASSTVFFYSVNLKRSEIGLRERYRAQEKRIELKLDESWKNIRQKYQVKGDYENTFKEGLKTLIEGRQGGGLFRSSTEGALGLSENIYRDMMNSIESQRGMFVAEQAKLVDIWREHNALIKDPIYSIFVKVNPLEEPIMITSTHAKRAYETKVDDDIDLNPSVER
jgi:hypothetical protein